jgi:hypothetical protein
MKAPTTMPAIAPCFRRARSMWVVPLEAGAAINPDERS